ncbi:hypothetical protein V6R21_23210 [Limibacter armeniacum]|uniref:hypothetical protein n=1 Tax=Limibacter armeniacum TaxID=466084 RepID=UPI002FE6439F
MIKHFFIVIFLFLTLSTTSYSQNFYLEKLYREAGQDIYLPYDHIPNVTLYIDGRLVSKNGFPRKLSTGVHEFSVRMKGSNWTWYADGQKYRVHSWEVLSVSDMNYLGTPHSYRVGENRFEMLDEYSEAFVVKLILKTIGSTKFKVHYLFRCGTTKMLDYQ